MAEEKSSLIHNVYMQKCREINMSGIYEVKAFDDETVVLDTAEGTLTVKGEGLLINSFSATSGDLLMQGTVWALVYSGNDRGKGFFKRILK